MLSLRSNKSRRNKKAGGPSGTASVDGMIRNGFTPGLSKLTFLGRLRYGAASLNFTSTTGAIGRYVFTANGLFDPNITGGALAPAGFSQLMLSYNHYVVLRANITAIFTNNATTPSIVGIVVHGDTSGSSDPSNMIELPWSEMTDLTPYGVYGSTKTLKMSVDISKFCGDKVRNDPIYRGDVLTNPSEQCYFHCLTYGLKGGSSDTFITVRIDYEAIFTEPRELNPSLLRNVLALVTTDVAEGKSCGGTDSKPLLCKKKGLG